MKQSERRIAKLDPEIVKRIAAGEVVQKPISGKML